MPNPARTRWWIRAGCRIPNQGGRARLLQAGRNQSVCEGERYRQLGLRLGRTLLLGLEILVAADIVRTVALEATLESVVVLALLVLVRTFLSWALEVEIEGRWPWQPKLKG